MHIIYPIILASASPRRKRLLQMLGLNFQVMVSSFEESVTASRKPPCRLVMDLARGKAEEISRLNPEALVVAADTLVVAGKRILGKPSDQEEAREILRFLSGRWHEVYTGLALMHQGNNRCLTDYETTKVHFRDLTVQEIEGYLRTGEPMDKAGAYGIQGLGAILVDRIEGCFFNVMGLPVAKLALLLKSFGIDLLEVNGLVRSLNQESSF